MRKDATHVKKKTYIKAGYCVLQYNVLQGLIIFKLNFEKKVGHILMEEISVLTEKDLKDLLLPIFLKNILKNFPF